MQKLVVNTLFQEVTDHKMDPGKHENWTRIGNYDQLSIWQTWN